MSPISFNLVFTSHGKTLQLPMKVLHMEVLALARYSTKATEGKKKGQRSVDDNGETVQ